LARKILLADDSVTAQNMGRRILMDAGYEVVTVNNGSAALKRIAESKPDLIVLDVYMPGYGGLEVCQRIRESRETARIPVLLTVGKLEPFKPEEVRRVRADAFVVKPFEASELLTALTKLEDKIVPQPEPYKPGRFAKAIAAIEESASPSNEYGDLEKGWKNRIKIPPPHAPKSREAEPEPVEAAKTEAKHPRTETPTVAMLREVTAEEIAAIEAAVAAVRGHGDTRSAERTSAPAAEPISASEPVRDEKPAAAEAEGDSDIAPVTFAAAPPVESEIEIVPVSEPPLEEAAVAPAPEPIAVEAATPDSPVAAENPEDTQKASREEEVAAALASLAPAQSVGATGQVPVVSGPRWVADAVPLLAEDSAIVLDEEMQRALAEVAAAEALHSTRPLPSWPGSSAAMTQTAPAGYASVAEPAPPFSDVTLNAGIAETQPEKPEEAAFAAAASATDAVSALPAEAAMVVSLLDVADAPPAFEHTDPQREAELAAAWANWKQLRDSVTTPQFTTQLADVAAASLENNHAEPPSPQAASSAGPSNGNTEEVGAIASIVDSVLAELKPKLMEEIAKKMKK